MMKKYFFLSVLAVAMGAALASCTHSDDPSYDDVTPPVVNLASPTVSGVITDKAGNPIQGATITMGEYTATTDANGMFVISDVKPGTYTITADAEGKFSVSGTVEVKASTKQTEDVLFCATLPSEDNVITITVTASEGGEDNLVTEALEGNDLAEIPIEVEVPAGALSEDAEIIVVPLYDEDDAEPVSNVSPSRATRASKKDMLIGAKVKCSKHNIAMVKPIELSFDLDEELASEIVVKKLVGDEWVDIPFNTMGSTVSFNVVEFGSFGLFLNIVKITDKVTSEPLVFDPNVWDNLYGKAEMKADESRFTYGVGTVMNTHGLTVAAALLIEQLAYKYGAGYEMIDAVYPINVTLPIGTRLAVNGKQIIRDITVSALGITVAAKVYDSVYVGVVTSNRQHNGGGNNN